ncbi:MAG: glutamate--cysteine ligase, partial [Burkholderiales bacterium PBB5]
YLSNIRRLVQVFTQAGLNVRLGTLDERIKAPTKLALPDGDELLIEPLLRSQRRLGLKDFDPCTILVNNDLSAGTPQVLRNLHEQYLLPPLHAGWGVRRKSAHFHSYEEVAKKFAKLLGMDPWLINPMYGQCGEVDFTQASGLDCVQTNVDAMLTKVRRKYKEYGINEKPFVVVKADNGSHGAGIITVRDAKEIAEFQQRCAHQAEVQDVTERGTHDSLSAPGASFVPLAFAESNQLPKPGVKPGASAPNRFYMYGVIGRLAMLAASYELEATDPDAEVYD